MVLKSIYLDRIVFEFCFIFRYILSFFKSFEKTVLGILECSKDKKPLKMCYKHKIREKFSNFVF